MNFILKTNLKLEEQHATMINSIYLPQNDYYNKGAVKLEDGEEPLLAIGHGRK